MAEESKKAKMAISMDLGVLVRVRQFVDKGHRRSVSSVIEECVRRWLPELISTEAPELGDKVELLKCHLDRLMWRRGAEMESGEYGGEYEDEICDLQQELAIAERDAMLEAMEEKRRR